MTIMYRLAVCAAFVLQGCAQESCGVCMEEKCADLLRTCELDTGCACMAECVGRQGIPGVGACLGECDLSERPRNFAQVEECTAIACPDSGDECSTPSGWTPPEETIACEGSAAGIGGGAMADCGFDGTLVFDPDGAVLQLESDAGVCVRIERVDQGGGALANTSWGFVSLRVGPPGEVAWIDDSAGCWYSSHHNFSDWVHAWSGTRHYDLVLKEDGHGGTRTYQLYVFEQGPVDPAAACAATADGAMCIEGPIELFPVNP